MAATRRMGVQIGEGTVVRFGALIEDCYRPLLRIGQRVSIPAGVMFVAAPHNSRLAGVPYGRDHVVLQK